MKKAWKKGYLKSGPALTEGALYMRPTISWEGGGVSAAVDFDGRARVGHAIMWRSPSTAFCPVWTEGNFRRPPEAGCP